MKRDIWPGRQLYGYVADVWLPCIKGTEDMRPSIVNVEASTFTIDGLMSSVPFTRGSQTYAR